MSKTEAKQDKTNQDKTKWEAMALAYVGDVGDVIKNLNMHGKSSSGYDPGDIHKPPGHS